MSTSKTTPAQGKYALNYFNRAGRIELCRLLFAAANVEFGDNFVENLTDLDSELGYLPYLEVDGQFRVPFIPTITRFLAREFNMAGHDSFEMAKVDAIAQAAYNIIDSYYMTVFNCEDMDQKAIAMNTFLATDVENGASSIETLIGWYADEPDTGMFAVGSKLTYADLYIYELAKNYLPKVDSFVERFPRIYRIRDAVEKMPVIVEFNKSQEPIDTDMITEQAASTEFMAPPVSDMPIESKSFDIPLEQQQQTKEA